MNGLISYPSKTAGAVIYATKAKILSEEEEHIILVRPHSVEAYLF